MRNIIFTGIFDKYTPVDSEPHYLFHSTNKYLISCQDYPKLIGELSPGDLINIKANLLERCFKGIKLINVNFNKL